MARRRAAEKRKIMPDPKYGDMVLAKFINCMMWDGKKFASEKIVYGALNLVEERAKRNPIEVFHAALEKVSPGVEVRSRRVGGATYQVPMDISPERSQALGLRWLIIAARKRNEKDMRERVAAELRDASENRGGAVKRREDEFKMAEANKVFAHFRW